MLDDLTNRTLELVLNRDQSIYDACQSVVDGNNALVRMAMVELLSKRASSNARKQALKPEEKFAQLTMELGDERFQITDRPVRVVDEVGHEEFKGRQHATFEQAEASHTWRIRYHQREIRHAESALASDRKTESRMALAGIDITQTWHSIRHASTICGRCNQGIIYGDPFTIGHKVAIAAGGGAMGVRWEHESCNKAAKANP